MGFARDTHTSERLPGERIAKVIARSGLCSRRDAERLVAEGRVTVNGKRLDSPAVNVTANDAVLVDGTKLPTAEPVRLWRYHKPKGRVTTHRDPEGRPTVFEALPANMPRVISVGRLDFNTEGLLLLTNDGELARHLEQPATGWLRRYRVRANGKITQEQLDGLAGGVTVEGVRYAGIEARLDRSQGANVWLTLALREGKNREVRKIMEHLGLSVNRLIRMSFGPFALGDLAVGAVEEVKRRILADQLGAEVAERLGLREKMQHRHEEQRSPTGKTATKAAGAPHGKAAAKASGAPHGKAATKRPAPQRGKSAVKPSARPVTPRRPRGRS